MTTSRPIDSPQNTHVAAARSLLTRKGRAAASSFLAEGPHAVSEALRSRWHPLQELFVTQVAAERDAELVASAGSAGVAVRLVTDRALAAMGDTVTPQGMVGVVQIQPSDLRSAMTAGIRLAVMLDGIADPGNAGTVIRTADAAGADVVVVTAGSVDVWGGKSVRASAGSVFHVPIVTGPSVLDAVAAAKVAGCQVLATAVDGDTDLDDLVDSGALARPVAWLLGNEAHGVGSAGQQAADLTVRLPIYGHAESLNLAAAAAICLYASARAHRADHD